MPDNNYSTSEHQNSSLFKKEVLRFLLVGGIAVAIDAFCYYILMELELASASNAKRISFGVGAIWAFFANKFFTFGKSHIHIKEPIKFCVIYLIGFALNSLTHDLSLQFINPSSLSFILATSASTIWNFTGQKWWVFK